MSNLEDEIYKLNKYLNIKSSVDMIKLLLNPSLKNDMRTDTTTVESSLEKMIKSLLSVQKKAEFGSDMKRSIDEYCNSHTSKDNATKGLADRLKEPPTDKNRPPFSLTTWSDDQNANGYQRKTGVKSILGLDDSIKTSISVFEISEPSLNFSNRDCSSVATFLQLLPSIEISRAVPYFDCKVVTTVQTNEGEIDNQSVFDNGISIGKFLGGKLENSDNSVLNKYLLAKFSAGQTVDKKVLNNMEKNKKSDYPNTNAGMELFTTPQTLVQGNGKYFDLDARKNAVNPSQQSIMDPFRPLMTFESFTLNVVPATGMISTKQADVKIKLHDRSRMNEIAPLLVPARIGDVDLHIEWGWSHPESDPEKNIFGALINSMRVQEIYGVSNSSYSFTPEGQVDISLKLYTKGALNVAYDLIKGKPGTDGADQQKKLEDAVLAFREVVSNLRGEGYNLKDDLGAPDTLSKASSSRGILSLTEDQIKELNEFLKNLKKVKTNNNTTRDAMKKFSTAFSGALTASTDFAAQQTKNLNALFSDMFDGDDPYLVSQVVGVKPQQVNISHDTHISFAKFLLFILGTNLLHAEQKFDEIQFIFYPMNESAMWARELNVGQYPMSKSLLKDLFAKEFVKNPTMRIQTLLNLVRKIFMNNVGDDVYGFSEFYDSKNRLEIKKEIKEDKTKKANMGIKKQEIMKACYETTGAKFKKPNITMVIETVKDESGTKSVLRLHFSDANCSSYSSYADLWNSMNKSNIGTIAEYKRLKIKSTQKSPNFKGDKKKQQEFEKNKGDYSSRLNSHEEAFQKAKQFFIDEKILEKVGNEKYKIKGGPNRIRGLMASNMPTLKYGTEYSGILAASLSNNSNPQMETIQMQRAQKDRSKPNLPGDDGLPMRVRPAQLSLDVFGCPLVNFGQQFFVDFNTNSTIDDVYFVTGVSHNISPGEFKTQIKLTPMQAFGQFGALEDTLGDISDMAAEESE